MVTTVNMHEAKTQLSRLVEQAEHGNAVIIARAGKPVAKLVALHAVDDVPPRRIGFLAGAIKVPSAEVFNEMGRDEIARMFGVEE
jgi:prevent-host-death family protein